MADQIIKMPDVGEGVAEAELVEWQVKVGDLVREDTVLAAVMTDKATVEIPSPVDGEVTWLGAEIGDTVAVGSAIVMIKVAGHATSENAPATRKDELIPLPPSLPPLAAKEIPVRTRNTVGDRPIASPAVRRRAREAGIDLSQIPGSGDANRITHEDLDAFVDSSALRNDGPAKPDTSVHDIKVMGLRRRIAERMALSKSRIPHITYVEEVDVSALEDLRAKLNAEKRPGMVKLTVLPFLARAMVKAIAQHPQVNAVYDDEAGVIHRYGGIHIGIATQTPAGLMVPVVRHAETRDLWGCAAEIIRLAEAARNGTATRDELSNSTITISSLGAMGGVATTPVINHPEVAIVGVNKMMVRPVWNGAQFVPRQIMNLSSAFDHRVIDGWDAASFVQRVKALLETPALIFMD